MVVKGAEVSERQWSVLVDRRLSSPKDPSPEKVHASFRRVKRLGNRIEATT